MIHREAKQALRKAMTARLKAVTAAERSTWSLAATRMVLDHPAWAPARLVLAFLSMPIEMDTEPLVDAALAAGKHVAVPRIEADPMGGPGNIVFVELADAWRTWPRDRWNIPAPPAAASCLSSADVAATTCLALVPGLAFDRTGGRLGRGKGYYDRFLTSIAATGTTHFTAVGIGYGCQLVDAVPQDEWDRQLDDLALG
jgi:5-formyltetrahydrofolate cyclo-ligase